MNSYTGQVHFNSQSARYLCPLRHEAHVARSAGQGKRGLWEQDWGQVGKGALLI